MPEEIPKETSVTDEWVDARRECIQRQGFAARACPDANAIELKGGSWRAADGEVIGPVDNVWRRMELRPGYCGRTEFASPEMRDEILRRLTERR